MNNLQFTIYNLQKKRGFTMIETMVAVFVILVAVITPMSIASQALSTSRFAKDQITAFYLAQEGIELVRNVRDNNAIAKITWNEGILGVPASETICYSPNGCKADAKDLSISDCIGSCPVLKIDQNGIYNYAGGTDSQFIRTIKLKMIDASEILVTSTISWPKNETGFTITDILKNWP